MQRRVACYLIYLLVVCLDESELRDALQDDVNEFNVERRRELKEETACIKNMFHEILAD